MYISGYNITISEGRTFRILCAIYMWKHTFWEKTTRASNSKYDRLWGGGIKGNISTFRNVDLLDCKKDTLKT